MSEVDVGLGKNMNFVRRPWLLAKIRHAARGLPLIAHIPCNEAFMEVFIFYLPPSRSIKGIEALVNKIREMGKVEDNSDFRRISINITSEVRMTIRQEGVSAGWGEGFYIPEGTSLEKLDNRINKLNQRFMIVCSGFDTEVSRR